MGVRLMVVDDHRLLAEALASALKLRGHRVLAAAAPAAGAAELVITRAPEVCLLGTATPAEPGIFDPVVKIKRERPQVAVLVLGPVPSPRGIAAAFAAGASGYVRHDERIEGVERAIMKARAGEAAVAPQLLQGAFSELLNPAAQPDDEGQRLLQMLTPREVEVLVRVADGEDTRLIAAGMGIAPSTASVLSLFPALLALVSLLGVFGQGQSTTNALLDLVRSLGQGGTADQLRGPVTQMTQTHSAGFALVLGLLGALWSASGYVGAFGRALNRVYQVDEGRPAWKLRPLQLLLTLVGVIAVALVLVGLVVTGPLAQAVGDTIGLGAGAVTAWNIAKWPVMLAIVVVLVAMLYHATPNVRQPRFRWVSVGAAIAILVWVVASVAFGFYVANFGSYNKTYGSLAGVVVFLLWLWLTNLALLFGAEVDSELERSRELVAGIEAERTLQLPPRDTKVSEKKAQKLREHEQEGRELREEAVRRGAGQGDEDPVR